MTREEEIQEAIKDIHKSIDCNGLACWQCIKLSIGKGISWADHHPRKGLWDSEKVIEWLQNNAGSYLEDNHKFGEGSEYCTNELLGDLRKAMED